MIKRFDIALLALLVACSSGCTKKESEEKAATTEKTSAPTGFDKAVVESFPNALLAWIVEPDGKVRVDVRDKDNAPIAKSASGTLEWQGEGNKGSAKLAYDDGAKALVATGPALKQDLTELKYNLTLPSETVSGVLHVPSGGTQALVDDAPKTADSPAADAGGPNGGVVQTVGDDRVEVVVNEESDEVRVYVIDASGKSVPIGDRKVTLGVNADSSEVIVLTPSSDGTYLTGKWTAKNDPSRVTILMKKPGKSHVAIVGWRPGMKLLVIGAPKLKVKGKHPEWKDKDDDRGKAKGHDKDKDDDRGKAKGHDKDKDDDRGKAKGHDKDDDHGKGKGRGKGKD